MKKNILKKVVNVNEIESIRYQLEETKQLKDNAIIELLNILKRTNDHTIRKEVALFLVDNFIDKRILSTLISLIKKPELKMYNADLVYACSEYPDTKAHLNFFVDLVITGDFHVSWNAYQTILNMHDDFEKRKCLAVIKKLENAIDQSNKEKNDMLISLLKYFEQFI